MSQQLIETKRPPSLSRRADDVRQKLPIEVSAPAVIGVPDRYCSFPALARLEDGDILLAFRSGRNCYRDFPEALVKGIHHQHMDYCSEPWLARSNDGGRTWRLEDPPRSRELLADDHAKGIGYQDIGLTNLPDGRVLMTVFRWQYSDDLPPTDLETQVRQDVPNGRYQPFDYAYCLEPIYTICDSRGKNWTPFKPIDVPCPATGKRWGISTRNGGVLLDEDTVGQPFCYVGDDGTVSHLLKYHVARDTWSYGTAIADLSPTILMEEPLLHRGPRGELMGFYRSTALSVMFSNVSHDNGETWSKPMPTAITGHPFAALTLGNGDVLLAYGYRRKPFGIRLYRFRGGRVELDFEPVEEIVVRDDGRSADLGYPAMCFTNNPGEVLLAYYFNGTADDAPNRYIAVQRLHLDQI